MNYTKGEWKVEIVRASNPKSHDVYARIKPSVGYVGWDSMGVYKDPLDGKKTLKTLNEQAKCNARLISAAPDMYEVLKKVDSYFKRIVHEVGTNDCVEADYIEAFKPILAKAEGKNAL